MLSRLPLMYLQLRFISFLYSFIFHALKISSPAVLEAIPDDCGMPTISNGIRRSSPITAQLSHVYLAEDGCHPKTDVASWQKPLSF